MTFCVIVMSSATMVKKLVVPLLAWISPQERCNPRSNSPFLIGDDMGWGVGKRWVFSTTTVGEVNLGENGNNTVGDRRYIY
jgi:hypothetical protein